MNKFNKTLGRVGLGARDHNDKNTDYTRGIVKKKSIKIVCLNHTPNNQNF